MSLNNMWMYSLIQKPPIIIWMNYDIYIKYNISQREFIVYSYITDFKLFMYQLSNTHIQDSR